MRRYVNAITSLQLSLETTEVT